MSWRDPTTFEWDLLADTKDRWPEIIPLARLLTLAQRIEPLLLRNARQRFLPNLSAESESHLWFSPLVSSRSTREIVLHQGVVKVLAEQLLNNPPDQPGLDEVWPFTRLHTRHWTAEERLERDLRYYALIEQGDKVRDGLQDVLRLIAEEDDESKRIEWSRLVKRTLPAIAPGDGASREGRLLAQYASLALGDSGDWATTERGRLPDWLEERLPPPVDESVLGVAVHYDPEQGKVLYFVKAEAGLEQLAFPSPLPARLHIEADDQAGHWHSVGVDSRIRVGPDVRHLLLTTMDGRQWELQSEALPSATTEEDGTGRAVPLVLSYVKADQGQAEALAAWLRGQGMTVDLLLESDDTPEPVAEAGNVKLVRLWTRAADRYWRSRPDGWRDAVTHGLLLRTESIDAPESHEGRAISSLDWSDWQRLADSPEAHALLDPLRNWLEGRGTEPEAEPAEPQSEFAAEPAEETDREEEIQALLKELENPDTEPPRRLEIGDRLAELGDPRPGVGVREIEVPVEIERESAAVESEAGGAESEAQRYPEEIQGLLDEIDDPATEPPRRLEIGDQLDRLGDPRKGVGLDENGLPDIDWVEIPEGAFVYQDGETRELPAFRISRYPITNRQYQAFVEAGGYGDRKGLVSKVRQAIAGERGSEGAWWQGLKRPKLEKSHWSQSNRPRTDVDWYEAVAFSRWLSLRLTGAEGVIRLPREEEWEKATRGEQGLLYPWGSEYRSGFANVNETENQEGPWFLEQTTAVGLYPQGVSPNQVHDLSGTVWEWCLNKPKFSEKLEGDSKDDLIVLRGGSWLIAPGRARAVSRNKNLPEMRDDLRGFRIVSSIPMPDGGSALR